MKNLLCLLPLLALSTFAAAPPPANDDFANRTALVSSGSISIADRNASATTQALEPTIAGDVVSRSVWYSWTAPFTGPVTVSTAGSSFDTLLGVFTGTALGALTSIAENDDSGNGAFTSVVNFNAISGIPYVILVGGYNGAGGKIRLAIGVGSGPCSYSVNPTSKSFSNLAGSGTVTVTTTTGCSWSAASNDSFITITSGSTGTGTGTVTYSVTANTALTARVGTMTIAGATVTIDQAAAPACTYALFPTSTNAPANSVTNTVAMTTGTTCTWNATPNGSWITISSGSSGTGSGTITYVLAANTNSNQRVGTITAAGQTFTVTQAGVVACSYSIAPSSGSFTSAGGSSNIVVSTISGCAWTASSPVTWVTFSSTNGTGNGTVTYTAAANTNTVSRSTTLTVAGQPYAVLQTGAACSYSINPSSINVSATNGTSTVFVAAGTGCAWTAVANVSWITITAGTSGTGSGSVVFTYAANLNTVIRAGTITIAGLTFTVNQAAAECIYSIAPTAAHYVATGGPGNIAVTAGTGCAWTAVSNNGFITVDSGSPGTASGTVGYTVTANATTVSRTGTITVAGSTFTITQDGTAPCTYSIAPTSASFTSLGGTNSIAVTSNAGCTWSVSSGASFLAFSPASGSGNGTVSYTVAANTSSLTRTGTLTVAGQTFTVTQTGVACTYAIAPTAASYASPGGSGTVAVTATQGCNWTSSSDSPWLVVISGSSGTGNGSVGYTVAAATNSLTRTGRLTIATKLLIVTQTGVPCSYSIVPVNASFDLHGGSATIDITASDTVCAWTATSGAAWITVAPASGSGNDTVTFTVASTSASATRTGNLTVAGQTFAVTQTGDTTAPTVTLTAPANATTVSNIITISATATDNSSVSRVEFYRDSATLIGTIVSSPYSLPFQTTNIANGSHLFYARGFDPANNQGFSTTNTVTVSNGSLASTNLWAIGFGSIGADIGKAVAVEQSTGNIYVGGAFSGTANFGGGALTNAGGEDIFLAKYATSGAHTWSKRFGGATNDRLTGLGLDSSGNVIAVGHFTSTTDFGGGALAPVGGVDIFVAKFDSTGTYLWAKRFGSTGDEYAYSVAVDSTGNVFLTGLFQGTFNFGGTNLVSTSGGIDTYVAKLSGVDGSHIWSENFPINSSNDIGNGIAVDPSGNPIFTGSFLGAINFGGGVLSSAGSEDVFLVKLAGSNGAHTWSKSFGSTGIDIAYGVTVDASSNVVAVGSFSGSVNFGGGALVSAGAAEAFVMKYTGPGVFVWAARCGGIADDTSKAVAVDTSGNVVVTGSFQGTAQFGTGTLTAAGVAGASDIFAAKYSPAGLLLWAKAFGGPNSDQGAAIGIDATGSPIVSGYFFGTGTFNGQSLTSNGNSDVFLMKLAP